VGELRNSRASAMTDGRRQHQLPIRPPTLRQR
jgi:hypothetical protein